MEGNEIASFFLLRCKKNLLPNMNLFSNSLNVNVNKFLAVNINDNNIKQNPRYYKRSQAICEHPFGTLKRHWGYTHTLLKGLQKVNGEMNLIMFCYNFMRTKNILGFDKMLETIQNWQPDYSKIVCAFKTAFIKMIYSQSKPFLFLINYSFSFLKAA